MTEEYLANKLKNFQKAFASLELSLKRDWRHDDGYRDSVIQRFEYTVETGWKFYKAYFDNKELDLKSPKQIFRETFKFKILDEDEVVVALEMLEARNMSSHTYREEIAIEISEQVLMFIPVLTKLLDQAKTLASKDQT